MIARRCRRRRRRPARRRYPVLLHGAARACNAWGQERSFGSGSREGVLPMARAVRVIDCPADADAAWLKEHVLHTREPAVLRGVDLGQCRARWTPEYLAAAECTAAQARLRISAHAGTNAHACHVTPTPRKRMGSARCRCTCAVHRRSTWRGTDRQTHRATSSSAPWPSLRLYAPPPSPRPPPLIPRLGSLLLTG